ncbi:hypothetical protein [Pelagibacterium halotolerans]|uniref:hypothetical protein n=1 Tax=Pelagibacterium halotolerans TaxID=531813 RepID=UPI00089619C0|nr:hypothetical protein [Pelagibacterium halotolerans]QJR17627.1 hypothetical protein HKM20_03730 [Pelagibacterium halotolerans]SEA84175.1 hypothetical protein SAMN05428936_10965 [Pelagibacterium halotolerans]
MKIAPPRSVKAIRQDQPTETPAPAKRIPAPAGGSRFVDGLAKHLEDEKQEQAGKLDMDALSQEDGPPVVDLCLASP